MAQKDGSVHVKIHSVDEWPLLSLSIRFATLQPDQRAERHHIAKNESGHIGALLIVSRFCTFPDREHRS